MNESETSPFFPFVAATWAEKSEDEVFGFSLLGHGHAKKMEEKWSFGVHSRLPKSGIFITRQLSALEKGSEVNPGVSYTGLSSNPLHVTPLL